MASHPQASSESSSASPPAPGWEGIASDWASDKEAFKQVPWGKAMMWIFLLSDTFIFTCFLTGYMSVRMTTTAPWPNPSEVFALTIAGQEIPLILIAIMTFVLISSSGTMARNACGRIISFIDCQCVMPSASAALDCPREILWIPARIISE